MFAEALRKQPLAPLLRASAGIPNRGLVPPASDRIAWEGLSPEKQQAIRDLAARYAGAPWPMRTASAFLAFTESGSRQADEAPYFLRRRKFCSAVLLAALDPAAPLTDVIDGLWLLCEETSWVISAHNVNPVPGAPSPREFPLPDPDKPYIDLFSAQTAMILSYALAILSERLDAVTPMLSARVRRELKVRVLAPFQSTDDFWWMGVRRKDLNNWTPWILSNLMITACLFPMPETELASFLSRACIMLDRWLAVVPEDGGCDEGAGYWNMAGGALLDGLELLETVTGGAFSFRQDRKVRNILTFPLLAEIGNGWFVNFADCDARPFLSGERIVTAGEMLGDPALVALGRRHMGTVDDQLNDVPHLSRVLSLLFHPETGSEKAGNLPADKDAWLPDLQLRVLSRGPWSFCAKGGHNGENHNHNDVGSFMLYRNGEPLIADAGNMVYTALTFSDRRYTLWNVRAAYHNLPLVGGTEQAPGQNYAAREVRCLPDGLSLEIAGAYPAEAELLSCRRILKLTEEGLVLTDRIVTKVPKPVTWVFILREKPALSPGLAASGSLALRFPEALAPALEEIPVTDSRMARNFPGSLWRLMLSSAPAADQERIFSFTAEP